MSSGKERAEWQGGEFQDSRKAEQRLLNKEEKGQSSLMV